MYTRNCIESSNLSFTATFYKHKPLIFLEKVGGLWFMASPKCSHGTTMGLALYSGAKASAKTNASGPHECSPERVFLELVRRSQNQKLDQCY